MSAWASTRFALGELRRALNRVQLRRAREVRRNLRELDSAGRPQPVRPGWFAGLVRTRRPQGVWAVSMVKDEQDVVGFTIEHLLAEGVDRILVADNLSSDGTRAVLRGWAARAPVTILEDRLFAYYQADKMTHLARLAAARGAGWIVPFDADELWCAPGSRLADFLADCSCDVVRAPVFDQLPAIDDDLAEPNPFVRLRHRTAGPELHKVAFRSHRLATLTQGNHKVLRPGTKGDGLEVRHAPLRTFEQYCHKVRNGASVYEATDLEGHLGSHWRRLGGLDDEALRAAWVDRLAVTRSIIDPAPFRSL